MSQNIERAQLPSTELGEDRCFEIGYFGHGDIVASTWRGPIDHDPRNSDGISTRFGFTHGSDATILASMSGFLARCGIDRSEVGRILLEAGQDIIVTDDEFLRYHDSYKIRSLARLALGEPAARYDVNELGLMCLEPPIPAQPGVFSRVGGTTVYTRYDEEKQKVYYVLGRHEVAFIDGDRATELKKTAEFCTEDIPTMAKLVCDLSLGEYRRDIQAFLHQAFINPEDF